MSQDAAGASSLCRVRPESHPCTAEGFLSLAVDAGGAGCGTDNYAGGTGGTHHSHPGRNGRERAVPPARFTGPWCLMGCFY